jgi:hypothetical protein
MNQIYVFLNHLALGEMASYLPQRKVTLLDPTPSSFVCSQVELSYEILDRDYKSHLSSETEYFLSLITSILLGVFLGECSHAVWIVRRLPEIVFPVSMMGIQIIIILRTK